MDVQDTGLTTSELLVLMDMLPGYPSIQSNKERIIYLKFAGALSHLREENYLLCIEFTNKVAAIKAYRALTHQGLKECKEFIESGKPIGPLSQEALDNALPFFDVDGVTALVEVK